MPSLFEIDGLSLELGGAEVLSVPALLLREGECVALTGPNGAGKTCLLKVLAGLLCPSAGLVSFCGRPIDQGATPPRRLVYLHQHPYIMAGSVSYNVEFGALARGSSRREAAERADLAMKRLGLEGFGHRAYRALSGGEAQRIALARALVSGCDVLLLDEPTASADTGSRAIIADCMRAEAQSGSTIAFATHDEALILALGARRLRLEGGKLIEGAA